MSTNNVMDALFQTIIERKKADSDESYVASLYAKGTAGIAKKVGEEATETIIEAMKGNKDKLAQESADLLFHLMILWADQNLTPKEIIAVLESRLGTSGHEEKKSRS